MAFYRAANGQTFHVACDPIEVTSLHRPDIAWSVTDAARHTHQWYTGGKPATAYQPDARYVVPSIVKVHDGWGYYEDGERYEIFHYECRGCKEHIKPGYRSDDTRQFIAGLKHYYVDDKPVSRDDFYAKARAAGVPGV